MGAGASTGKASKSSITKGGAKALEEAAKSEAKAKKLFVKLDADQDGKISLDELKAGVAKHAVDIASTWTSEQLALTIAFFDRDGDGKLSEPEFMSVIEELKVRGADDKGGVAAAAAIADKSKRRAAYAATFDKYKGDRNGVERKHMAQLIRDINDQQGIWDADAFGPLVKAQWEILVQSTDKQAVADLGQFCTWYAGLEKIIEDVKRQWVEEEAAAKAAKECQPPGGTRPTFSGDVWDCPMSKLQFAYMQAWESNMTPLLVDTTNDGKDQDFSPLETFFGYSGEGLIELKKAVVEVGMKKTKSLEQVQEEFAEKLALCLKQGRCLTLLCSNSAPPFLSKHVEPIARTAATPEYANPTFPAELLDVTKLKPLLGAEADLKGSFLAPVEQWLRDGPLARNPSYNFSFVHPEFRVAVVTKFALEDYREFLGAEWDFSLLQPIKVFTE